MTPIGATGPAIEELNEMRRDMPDLIDRTIAKLVRGMSRAFGAEHGRDAEPEEARLMFFTVMLVHELHHQITGDDPASDSVAYFHESMVEMAFAAFHEGTSRDG